MESDFEPEPDFKLKGDKNFNGSSTQNQESLFDKNCKGEEDVYDGVKPNNSILSERSNCVDGASPLQPEKIMDVLDVECKTSENLSTSTVENIVVDTGNPRSYMIFY